MRKRKLLRKEKIQQIIEQHKQIILEIEQLGAMAEEHRREIRNHRRPRKRKTRLKLKSTDYLSVEQFAEVIRFVKSGADEARSQSPYLCRVVVTLPSMRRSSESELKAVYGFSGSSEANQQSGVFHTICHFIKTTQLI